MFSVAVPVLGGSSVNGTLVAKTVRKTVPAVAEFTAFGRLISITPVRGSRVDCWMEYLTGRPSGSIALIVTATATPFVVFWSSVVE